MNKVSLGTLIGQWRGVATACALMTAAGCGGNARLSEENDRLRGENLELKAGMDKCRLRERELLGELAALSSRSAASMPSDMTEEIRAATPHVAQIAIGKLSHVVDSDGDGRADAINIYVSPVDGRGRFVPMVGTLEIAAGMQPRHGEAATLGRATFRPLQVLEAYRSSFTGTHYSFQVPLTAETAATMPAKDGDRSRLMINAWFVDGQTGMTHQAERSIDVRVRDQECRDEG